MGDKSDNIPGVYGIGEKTGIKLVKEFGKIENIYDNLDNISSKSTKNKLEGNLKTALMSRELGRIIINLDYSDNLEDYKISKIDKEEIIKDFENLEFNTFLEELDLTNPEENNGSDRKLDFEKIDNLEDFEKIFKSIKDGSRTFMNILFENEVYTRSKPFAVSLKKEKEDLVYIYYLKSSKDFSNKYLASFLSSENIVKIFYDSKPCHYALIKENIDLNCYEDISIMSYLNSSNNSGKSLDEYLSLESYPLTSTLNSLIGSGKKKKSLDEIPKADLNLYLASSTFYLEEAFYRENKILEELELRDLYKNLELPLVRVLASMEEEGFKVDSNILNEINNRASEKIKDLEKEIIEDAGYEFKVSSPKQVGEVLFDKLGLPVIKKTKTGYSTDIKVLEKLIDKHVIVQKIIDYRFYTKLKSTYIDGLIPLISDDGKIHTTFMQNVAQTGRLSSVNPNLQNIPQRSDLARKIRKAFIAGDKRVLVDSDYSQIELRVLASLSEDENMISAFKEGVDIHTKTASEVFHKDPKDVTREERSHAKAVNFGIIYGQTDYGLSEELKISRKEAREYIDGYKASYPQIKTYMDEIVELAKEKGYSETILGRKRAISELHSSNFNIRSFGERMALNTPIQGSAADIIKKAMLNVYNKLKENGLKSKLILQVHDELIVETFEEELDQVKKIVKEEMENVIKLEVQLIADISIGKSWYDAK